MSDEEWDGVLWIHHEYPGTLNQHILDDTGKCWCHPTRLTNDEEFDAYFAGNPNSDDPESQAGIKLDAA